MSVVSYLRQKFQNWKCRVFGHKLVYSPPGTMMPPRRCECVRCGRKWKASYKGNIIKEPENIWKEVKE